MQLTLLQAKYRGSWLDADAIQPANAHRLPVEVHDRRNVVRELALVAPCAHALGEVKADLCGRPCICCVALIGPSGVWQLLCVRAAGEATFTVCSGGAHIQQQVARIRCMQEMGYQSEALQACEVGDG